MIGSLALSEPSGSGLQAVRSEASYQPGTCECLLLAPEIADALRVSEGTVKSHAPSTLSKLGVRDCTRAVVKALEQGRI